MKPTVKLREIAEYISDANDETNAFYNELTGEFYLIFDFEDLDPDDEEYRDIDEEEGWLRLPNQRDAREYDMMTDFTDTVGDAHVRRYLEIALSGRGAFRRFKDTVIEEGIADRWYAFRDGRYHAFARAWCEENSIPYDGSEPTGL